MTQSTLPQRRFAIEGMSAFTIIWFGQLISLIGSGLTTFGLGVWAYQGTGSVTLFALITLAGTLPSILVAPVAGALVDRWNRRRVLIASDALAAAVTLVVALLLWAGQLAIWHIYIAVAISSTVKAFQLPAYTAATTMLIPKQQFARASGMTQFGTAAAQTAAPLLAGVLVVQIGLPGVILIDVATFLVAVATLMLVAIPQPPSQGAAASRKGLLREAGYGLRYIAERPGLLGLLIFFAIVNFAYGMAQVLFTPLVLKFASTETLGTVLAAGGLGFLVGSLLLTSWGGPKRRVYGVLGFGFLFGLGLMLAGVRASAVLIWIASFGGMVCVPIVNGCSQAIWQVKVPPEVQGRVFATRLMIAWSAAPLAFVIAGPLADGLFEPLLASGGALSGSVGQLIGTGPGRGIGLLFVLIGLFPMLAALGGFLHPRVRLVEDELPDAVGQQAPARAETPPAEADSAAAPA